MIFPMKGLNDMYNDFKLERAVSRTSKKIILERVIIQARITMDYNRLAQYDWNAQSDWGHKKPNRSVLRIELFSKFFFEV